MATGMEDAAEFGGLPFGAHLLRIAACDVDAQLFFQDVNLFAEREFLTTEYPRTAEGRSANHHSVDAVCVEGPVSIVQRLDVAIANDRDMDARITLYLTDKRPVGIARVHLTAGATMNGQCLDAAVLQLFSQGGDDELFVVPAQASLRGDR